MWWKMLKRDGKMRPSGGGVVVGRAGISSVKMSVDAVADQRGYPWPQF
jgi:hypothetical protein